jgi:hypothetical protein
LKGNQKSSGRPSLDTRSPNIVQLWPGYSWQGNGGYIITKDKKLSAALKKASKEQIENIGGLTWPRWKYPVQTWHSALAVSH